jgi:hypothetical protein
MVVGILLAGKRAWSRAGLAWVGASALLALAAAYPFVAPYLELARGAPPRSRPAIVHWSARPASFLTAAPEAGWLPHLALLERWGGERETLYPGTPALLLAAVGLLAARPGRWVRALIVIGVGAAVFSLGPVVHVWGVDLPGPYTLIQRLPLGDMMRVPARLAVLSQMAVCALAALGWRALAHDHRRAGALIRAGCVALWLAESSPRAVLGAVREIETSPAFASWLAAAPPGPVLELPYRGEGRQGIYVYWSSKHWLPLVNGHGTFRAERAVPLVMAGKEWPSPKALRTLRGAGVRYVVVHGELASDQEALRYGRALARPPNGAALRFREADDAVFEIVRP